MKSWAQKVEQKQNEIILMFNIKHPSPKYPFCFFINFFSKIFKNEVSTPPQNSICVFDRKMWNIEGWILYARNWASDFFLKN